MWEIKRKRDFTIVCVLLVLFVFGLLYPALKPIVKRANQPEIKVGQVWQKVWFRDNPYEKDITENWKIIDVSGEYFQYVVLETGDTTSTYAWRLDSPENSKLIKP